MRDSSQLKQTLADEGIRILPSVSKKGNKGGVIPMMLTDVNDDLVANGSLTDINSAHALLEPLVPEGYRCEIMDSNPDYESRALYIGKEFTVKEKNDDVIDSI